MKRIIKDTLVLFAITLISGLLLGGVYRITKSPIEAQAKAKTEKAYKAVFQKYYEQVTDAEGAADSIVSAMSFDEWSEESLSAQAAGFMSELGDNTANTLDAVVTSYGSDGNVAGYVVTITNSEAYGGSIQMSVGILVDGTVAGVEILSISETPGLGMNAQNDSFLGQFTGVMTDVFSYTKTGKQADNEIDAISSATYTTKSMTNGVNAALAAYRAILKSSVVGAVDGACQVCAVDEKGGAVNE